MANPNKYYSKWTGKQVDDAVGNAANAITKDDIVQVKGKNLDKVMSQYAVTNALENVPSSEDIIALRESKLDKNLGIERANKWLKTDAEGNIITVNNDAENDIIEGYYFEGKFYYDISHTNLIVGEENKVYIDLTTRAEYIYTNNSYVLLGIDDNNERTSTTYSSKKINELLDDKLDTNLGTANANKWLKTDAEGNVIVVENDADNDIIEGYYFEGKFYSDELHTKLITGEDNKVYIDLSTHAEYIFRNNAYILLVIDDSTERESTTYSSVKIQELLDNVSVKSYWGVITLSSADWNNNRLTINIPEKVDGYSIRLSAWQGDENTTDQEVLDNSDALNDARIYRIIEDGSDITFVCETTPTTDLKINFLLFAAEEIKNNIKSYITFKSATPFTINTSNNSKNWDSKIEYSTDLVDWVEWDGTTTPSTTELYMRGTGNTVITGGYSRNWVLNGTQISCDGNIETLLDYETVKEGNHPPMASYSYTGLFQYCTSLTSAPQLPATTLAVLCYSNMFFGCSNLTTATALPATNLAEECYSGMFTLCTSLETAPELPATTLATGCYVSMFAQCTNLQTASKLQATVLVENCYFRMFDDCTSLVNIPALPATTLTDNCYSNMFNRCTSIKLSATQTDEYTKPYRIPTDGDGTTATNALYRMFVNTSGTFADTPTINTTYYLHKDNNIIMPDGTIV